MRRLNYFVADVRPETSTLANHGNGGPGLQIAYAATSATPSGAYVKFTKVAEPSAFSRSPEGLQLEADFWKEFIELWAGIEPGVGKILA